MPDTLSHYFLNVIYIMLRLVRPSYKGVWPSGSKGVIPTGSQTADFTEVKLSPYHIRLVLLFFHNAVLAHKHPHAVVCIFRLAIRIRNSGFDVVSLEVEDGVQTLRVREPRRVRRGIGG